MNKNPIPFAPSLVATSAAFAATRGREIQPQLTSSPRISTTIPVPRPQFQEVAAPDTPLTETEQWNLDVDRRNAKKRVDKILTKMFGDPKEFQEPTNAA